MTSALIPVLTPVLQTIAPDMWHIEHPFRSMGLAISSRMTVVRLSCGGLWLHSPVAVTDALCAQLDALGPVRHIVAPNRMHHLFAGQMHAAYPQAALWGAPGLRKKRPDLASLREIPMPSNDDAAVNSPAMPWHADLAQHTVGGMPLVNETVWFHRQSRTLIVTDLAMWFQGNLPWKTRCYGHFNGVMGGLALSRLVRWVVKDKKRAAADCRQILQWPIERVVVAHNCIVEADAKAQLQQAWSWFEA